MHQQLLTPPHAPVGAVPDVIARSGSVSELSVAIAPEDALDAPKPVRCANRLVCSVGFKATLRAGDNGHPVQGTSRQGSQV